MGISVSKKNPNYKSINASGFHDENLSLKAKGLLVYLLMKPDGWKGHIFEVVSNHPDGEQSVQTAMKELITNQYVTLKREYSKDKKRFIGSYYEVHDEQIPNIPLL